MRFEVDIGGRWLSYVLIGVGLWWLVRSWWQPGPWYSGATLGVLALGLGLAYRLRERRWSYLTGAWLLAAWAVYLLLDAYLLGGLPFAFFFAFLGLAFFGVYAFGTRPALWPVLPGSLLLGLATVLWVLSVGFQLAPYLLPLLLVAGGIWLVLGGSRNR